MSDEATRAELDFFEVEAENARRLRAAAARCAASQRGVLEMVLSLATGRYVVAHLRDELHADLFVRFPAHGFKVVFDEGVPFGEVDFRKEPEKTQCP